MGCMTYCFSVEGLVNDTCNDIGRCETSIPEGVSNITTEVFSYHNHTYVGNFNPCSSAAVVANDAFVFSTANMSTTAEEYSSGLRVPVVLNWTNGSKSCDAVKTDQTVLCNENSNCTDPPREVGYRCQCWTSYEGNPYIAGGCQGVTMAVGGGFWDHLTDEAKASQLTWEKRLSIATEVAGVLSHLHTKASPPILHRDMKPANILLLDNYTAKVADFGCSQLVVRNPSQFRRTILGTYGYIDPEALTTGELTEESDGHLFEILDEKIKGD
ncbi:hypothetical protein Ancab_008414 [Ancistrocladus abbreviatus]